MLRLLGDNMSVGYVAAAGFQIWSAYEQSQLMKEQYALQNEIDRANIEIQEFNNWQQRGHMQKQLAAYSQQQSQEQASQKVALAARGINVKEGSVADVVEQNKLTTMFNTMDAENRMIEAINNQNQQVRNSRFGAEQNYRSGMVQANAALAGGIMSGVGKGLKAIDYTGLFSDDLDNSKASTSGSSGSTSSGNARSINNYLMMG